MYKTIIRRVMILIPQLLAITMFVFLLSSFMPGDALQGREDPTLNMEMLEAQRERLGLNDPWYTQYGRWLRGILRGDFGMSISNQNAVLPLIGQRLTNTFWLALLTIILIYIIAIPLGLFAGRYNDKVADRAIGMYTYFAMALPTVVFAIVLLLIFGFRLQWFPIRGSVTLDAHAAGGIQYIISRLHHMALPATTGALLGTIAIIQYLRGEVIAFKSSDYVMTAKSKGTPERKLYSRHILRNALIPVAANAGLAIVGLFTGAIFVETIFSYPGMGRLFIDSITTRDFTVINAIILLSSFLIAVGVLISDILLATLDPRIRIK